MGASLINQQSPKYTLGFLGNLDCIVININKGRVAQGSFSITFGLLR